MNAIAEEVEARLEAHGLSGARLADELDEIANDLLALSAQVRDTDARQQLFSYAGEESL